MARASLVSLKCLAILGLWGLAACGRTNSAHNTEPEPTRGGTLPSVETTPLPPHGKVGAISERSFEVHAKIARDDLEMLAEGCSEFVFTARFRQLDGAWVFEAAAYGQVAQAALQEVSPGTYAAIAMEEPSYPGASVLQMPSACDRWLELTKLTFVGGAADETGAFTTFSARASGDLITSCGDCSYNDPATVELEGAADRNAPTLKMPAGDLHPLDIVTVPVVEALLDAKAFITPAQGAPVLVAPSGSSEDAIWSLDIPPLLRLGTKLTWQADGHDWSSNPLVSQSELRTLPDPGVLPEDGFESDVPVLLTAAPHTIAIEGALSGTHSLLIESGVRATFHLRHAGARKLLFQFRPMPSELYGVEPQYVRFAFVQVRFGTLGGTQVVRHSLEVPDYDAEQSEPSASVAVELDLPEPGDDVLVSFDIAAQPFDCGPIACSDVPSLIDDLRLE
jgi:hypothetical protein